MSNFEYLLLFATDKRNWKKSKKSFEIRNYMSSKNNSQKNPPYNNNSNNTIFGSKRYGKKNYGCPQSALFCRMLAQDFFFFFLSFHYPQITVYIYIFGQWALSAYFLLSITGLNKFMGILAEQHAQYIEFESHKLSPSTPSNIDRQLSCQMFVR